MTKLAPIKEFTKFGMRENRGLTVFNDVELELARQAIIRDFVVRLSLYIVNFLMLINGMTT